jgi:hypothetical protein
MNLDATPISSSIGFWLCCDEFGCGWLSWLLLVPWNACAPYCLTRRSLLLSTQTLHTRTLQSIRCCVAAYCLLLTCSTFWLNALLWWFCLYFVQASFLPHNISKACFCCLFRMLIFPMLWCTKQSDEGDSFNQCHSSADVCSSCEGEKETKCECLFFLLSLPLPSLFYVCSILISFSIIQVPCYQRQEVPQIQDK